MEDGNDRAEALYTRKGFRLHARRLIVRTGSKLHRRAVLYAQKKERPLNTLVVQALENFLPKT